MDKLAEILQTTLSTYTGHALNGESFLTVSQDATVYAIVSIGELPDNRVADAGLIVRIIGHRIVIERDVNDKLLVDALRQAGLRRDQIVLAYAGEPISETTV